MSAAAEVRPALMGHLKDLHLPTVRECYEETARRAERETLSRQSTSGRGIVADVVSRVRRNLPYDFQKEYRGIERTSRYLRASFVGRFLPHVRPGVCLLQVFTTTAGNALPSIKSRCYRLCDSGAGIYQ
jgi:hypothetical protein